jgi:hypothetical protein
MIPIFINQIPVRALIDTGADISLISGRIYNKISKNIKAGDRNKNAKTVLTANATPLKITAETEVELKINGLQIPFTVSVIEELNYDIILGLNFLDETQAVIDVSKNSLVLYQGLLSVPMTPTGEAALVRTVAHVTIPAMSEATFPVKPSCKLNSGNYIIEGELQSPSRGLLIARTLVNPANGLVTCRAMNTTDKPIKFRPGVPVGALATVTIPRQGVPQQTRSEQLPTVAEMQNVLQDLNISFKDTALTGRDFDNLVTLLYRNRDLIATSLNELPGTDVLMHRIDTGTHPPIKKRSYRHSPSDREEIARQVKEMYDAGIIQNSASP